MLIHQKPSLFGGYLIECKLKLRAAITAQAVEDIAREALGMDAHKRRRAGVSQFTHRKRESFLGPCASDAFERANSKPPESGGEVSFCNLFQREISQ